MPSSNGTLRIELYDSKEAYLKKDHGKKVGTSSKMCLHYTAMKLLYQNLNPYAIVFINLLF